MFAAVEARSTTHCTTDTHRFPSIPTQGRQLDTRAASSQYVFQKQSSPQHIVKEQWASNRVIEKQWSHARALGQISNWH